MFMVIRLIIKHSGTALHAGIPEMLKCSYGRALSRPTQYRHSQNSQTCSLCQTNIQAAQRSHHPNTPLPLSVRPSYTVADN